MKLPGSILLFGALPSTLLAQNDECSGAIPLPLGTVTYDTQHATTSVPAWPCANGGSDLWFSHTATTNQTLTITLCVSGYDTALEVFTGDCAS